MKTQFPFLASCNRPGTTKGTFDPLEIHQIAEKLVAPLVPVVRERIQRIRFVTANTLGPLRQRGSEARTPSNVMNQE
jgi:hypothetical protein